MNFHCVNMDCVGWLWLVVLCSRLIRASAANGMGRKVLTDLKRVSPILLGWVVRKLLCMYGLFSLYSLFLPYLWQDRKTLGKERPLALLWSEP